MTIHQVIANIIRGSVDTFTFLDLESKAVANGYDWEVTLRDAGWSDDEIRGLISVTRKELSSR